MSLPESRAMNARQTVTAVGEILGSESARGSKVARMTDGDACRS